MAVEWAQPYEAPISLDAPKLFGAHEARSTYWNMAALVPTSILLTVVFVLNYFWLELPWASWAWVLPVCSIWLVFCYVMRGTYGQRPPEHWLKIWCRHIREPQRIENPTLAGLPRAVVAVDTLNLRGLDDATLATKVKQLHQFYIGLKFPVQIVVRAWPQPEGWIQRKWFVAVAADDADLLPGRIKEIIDGLKSAGLGGTALNGNLYDELNACWSHKGRPSVIQRSPRYSIVDGEYVRGLLMVKTARAVDANWLSEITDGDLAVDLGIWLDPIDNADMQDELRARINNWQVAQLQNVGSNGSNGKLGYPDPEIESQIKDAVRVRGLIHHRQLRVFNCTIGFVVRGKTLAEMQENERTLLRRIREHVGDDAVLPPDFEQDKALLMVVPTGTMPLPYTMEVVSPVLARTYPFASSSLVMPGGIRCGASKGSTHENTLNVWRLMNPHMAILATSGAGKGFWLKVYMYRLLLQYPKHKCWIIQAEKDEYSALAEAIPGGQVIRYTSMDQLDERRPTGRVFGMHEVDDRSYLHRGIHWLAGGQITVYDLTRMPQADRGKAIARLLTMLEHATAHHGTPEHGYVVIDELGIVLHDKDAALAIETAYRRFRSIPMWDNPRKICRRGMIGLSQRPSDLLANKLGPGKVIADLSATKVYLRMESTELNVVERDLSLTPSDREYLELGEEGDALLVAGRKRIALRMNANSCEDALART